MTENYEAFLETLESPSTKRVAKLFERIGECEFTNGSEEEICALILDMRPNSPKRITDICYFLSCFAKYLKNEKLYQTIQVIDKKRLWVEAKPNAKPKFISHEQFQEIYDGINNYENVNWQYIQTIFRSIYEGIYCDDMSVLKNLKASDVKDDVVILKEDNGHEYQLQITKKLAENLKSLGKVNVWNTRNRHGPCKKQIEGLAPDSCFKVEIRKTNSPTSYRFSYYRTLRLVAQDAGYDHLLPLQIYVSGIMYRIGLALQAHNISISEAFADNNKDRVVSNIISEELKRCNYQTEVRNFRQIVKGHLDVFELLSDETKNADNVPFVKPSQEQLDDENLQDIVTYRELDCREAEKNVSYTGKAKPKRNKIKCEGRTIQPRNRAVAINALVLAQHKCEINKEHSTFIRKSDGLPYTEPHHLIPMAYADNFDVSLDVEENIVSLCSHCHNQLHYGKNIKGQLKILFTQREKMLKQVGLNISLEELVKMY